MRHSSFPQATDIAQRVISPRALDGAGASAILSADLDVAAPHVLVIDGDADAWAAAGDAAADALRASPAATIGIMRGRTAAALPAFAACDLRADADDDVRRWVDGFARAPQACTVAALLLRRPHDLVDEALAYSTLQAGDEFASWSSAHTRRTLPAVIAAPPRWDLEVAYAGTAVTVLAADGYREIVLTRPHRHNALDALMRAELCDVLATMPAEVRVGLRGIGPSFCSGGDLDEFGLLADPADAFFARTTFSVADALRSIGARLTVALHGACVGAGIELAAFAATVIAAPSTRIRLPEVDFGLIPGSGGTVSLPSRIGPEATLDLIVTGRWLDADEARSIGLVDEVVSEDALLPRLRAAGGRS